LNKIMSRRAKIAASSAILATLAAAGAAIGQDDALPPQGEFTLTVSLTEAGGAPVTIGEGLTAAAVSQTAHLFNADGGFLDYAAGNCASFQTVDAAAATIEITGYCSYRDADGDVAFEQFATDGAVPLDAIALAGEWTGGTGKYEMLTGETATVLSAAVNAGGVSLVGGTKTGTYSLAEPQPEPPAAATPPPPAANNDAVFAELMDEGADVYGDNCAFCHGAEGQGAGAPRLAGNDYLRANASLVGLILGGYESHGMPAFRYRLDVREIAAVATYVRNSWGNEFGITTEATVMQYYGEGGGSL